MFRRPLTATLLVAAALLAGCSGFGRITIKRTQAQLQRRLDKKFPLKRRKLVFSVSLHDPQLTLLPRTNRLQFRVRLKAGVLGRTVGRGSATITGGVRYDRQRHAFYLTDARVTRLDVARFPVRHRRTLRRAVDYVARRVLSRVPLYRLKKRTFKQSLARAFLKRVWIRDRTLYLELGL